MDHHALLQRRDKGGAVVNELNLYCQFLLLLQPPQVAGKVAIALVLAVDKAHGESQRVELTR